MKKNQILSNEEIHLKIKRIAYQIYEANIDEKSIAIVGIKEKGYLLASLVVDYLKTISDINIVFGRIKMGDDCKGITTDLKKGKLTNQSVVLVDDVLNTGQTLMHAAKHLLQIPLKRLKTVVLINRNHKVYPIKADFKGLSLSTSMNELVEVVFLEKSVFAYLY